jgi:hypothetical protein
MAIMVYLLFQDSACLWLAALDQGAKSICGVTIMVIMLGGETSLKRRHSGGERGASASC